MTDSAKRGRPRKFDKVEALEKATLVFWKKGYEGASLNDLTSAMGINGPSLYSAFGSKYELFIEAIKTYSSQNACAPLVAFESEPNIRIAVQAFLTAVISNAVDNPSGASGCFLSSCVAASSGEMEEVRALLNKAIRETDKRLAARFDFEKEKGVLSPDFPSLDRARLMFDLRQGYVLRARAGTRKKELSKDLDQRVRMILF